VVNIYLIPLFCWVDCIHSESTAEVLVFDDAMGTSDYFNPIPLFILFREAIEASIVVSVLLTFVSRSNPNLKSQSERACIYSFPAYTYHHSERYHL